MISQLSLPARFIKAIIPTKGQALLCVVVSLVILIVAHAHQVLQLIGIGTVALDASSTAFHARFDSILQSQAASSAALVTFWASVGLIAYLICWSAYNVLIEARNEVTLKTQYTNRGHWRGPYETMGLKAVGAVMLIGAVSLLKPGLALWLALAAPPIGSVSLSNLLPFLGATFGLAVQLYIILAAVIVTFTPWYRPEAFTEQY